MGRNEAVSATELPPVNQLVDNPRPNVPPHSAYSGSSDRPIARTNGNAHAASTTPAVIAAWESANQVTMAARSPDTGNVADNPVRTAANTRACNLAGDASCRNVVAATAITTAQAVNTNWYTTSAGIVGTNAASGTQASAARLIGSARRTHRT